MRNVGIVYQDLGLFPHLNVMENIRYGLRYHKDPAVRTDSESRISRLIDLLGLERIMDRSVENLSGGEKQRIALARCLAVNPSLVLLDEPLSSLDVNKRDEVQLLLKDLHENFQTTFLMVTHEFSQVMFLADRVAIINSGALEQIGPVSQVFERPRTPFVAKFLGMKNLWPATFNGRYAQVDRLQIRVTSENTSGMKYLGLRPENIRIHTEEPADGAENVFPVQITGVWNVGPYYEVRAQADEVVFSAFLTSGPMPKLHLKRGVRAHISFDSESVHVL
jgi:molybdate/tungstate transport system ATP-binding protein